MKTFIIRQYWHLFLGVPICTFFDVSALLNHNTNYVPSRLHSASLEDDYHANNVYLSSPQNHWSDLPYSMSQPNYYGKNQEYAEKNEGNYQSRSFVLQGCNHEFRDIPYLQQWAREDGGIQVKEGVVLEQEKESLECSTKLERPIGAGTAIVSIPDKTVLSSRSTKLSDNEIAECRQCLSQWNGMDQYLPEFLLMVHLLDEVSKGQTGFWYPYLNSLPSEFSTGLWMNEIERGYLERLAPDFLEHQNQQFEAFVNTFDLLSTPTDDTILYWAFSVVFTRSWRTPNGKNAVIVPIGDMFNHDSRNSNVYVLMTEDRVQIIMKESAVRGQTLYLDYGISERPERFLVMYGFFDKSCGKIFLGIPFEEKDMNAAESMGFTDCKLVTIDTQQGKLSKTAWDAVLYKVLLEHSTGDEAKMLRESIESGNIRIQRELHDRCKVKTAQWVSSYAEEMIEKYSIPALQNEVDTPSFRRQTVFRHYCAFMHSTWQRVQRDVKRIIMSEN